MSKPQLLLCFGFCFTVSWFGVTDAFQTYQTFIPNGHRVPHPCIPNSLWNGVGHENSAGGGRRNPFGQDFEDNLFVWDKHLCELDSDGDGETNGQELNDPDCTWRVGDPHPSKDGVSHPGVCDPITSASCEARNTFGICKSEEFVCNETSDPDSFYIDVRLAPFVVPNHSDTVYGCQVFPLDGTKDMHFFAMEPILDDIEIVHHIDLYECLESDDLSNVPSGSAECGTFSGCSGMLLASWNLGVSGICLAPEVGIRMGKYGTKNLHMNIHYNNPFLYPNRNDSSGLRLWLTEKIRPNDVQILYMHQKYLEIPPGRAEVEYYIDCSDKCTGEFTSPIYLVFGVFHMHKLGTASRLELWRNGTKIRTIMETDAFDMRTPTMESYNPAVEVLPGDHLITACVYQSLDETSVVWEGGGAAQEMCESAVLFYPPQELSDCTNKGKIHECAYKTDKETKTYWRECNLIEFMENHEQNLIAMLEPECDKTRSMCMTNCKKLVDEAHKNHTCLGPNYYEATLHARGSVLRDLLRSCAEYVPMEDSVNEAGHKSLSAATMMMILIGYYFF